MRFGLGWRAELGSGILANLDRIDVVEVLAEDYFEATPEQVRALRFLRTQVPVVLHATSLGLASTEPVERKRLDAIARVAGWLEPELWSEHLAFVRAGGCEIGHLAAPPRNDATLQGLVRNVEEARRVVGSLPLVENVASLVEPPCSSYSEEEWLHAVLNATDCDLLLDLHNLHANATNFDFDARELVTSLPGERIRAIHLAGGKRIERGRVLDDHLHAVPPEVYELLRLVDAPDAMVILERDGNYPNIEELLAELRSAATAVAAFKHAPARTMRTERKAATPAAVLQTLARLYTDETALTTFLENPQSIPEIAAIDKDDLRLAFRSFARKRANRH